MVFSAKLIDGNHQQSMVFSCIATDNSGIGVTSGSVGCKDFAPQGVFEVYKFCFVKGEICHKCNSLERTS
jgi:hypothetical protein